MVLRKKLLWAVTISLLLGLIVGGPYQWGFSKEDNSGIYQELKLFSEALSIIRNQYVDEEKVNDSKSLIYGAITGLLNSLEDPHTRFMKPDVYKEMQVETTGSFDGLGIVIGIKENELTVISPIEDTPAYRVGIKGGDKIIEIEGESTKEITLFEAVHKLRGPKGTEVTITIKREFIEEPFKVTITRDIIKIKSVKSTVIKDNIGYIRLTTFNENTCAELDEAIKKLKEAGCESYILDLRNNSGGLLNAAVGVTSRILPPETLIVSTKGRSPDQESEYHVPVEGTHLDAPLVVLINGGTASGSEIVAGAIQDLKRGVIVGTKSFGKGSVQSVLSLSDGAGIALTTAKYYTPSGKCIHEKGIEPDIEVEAVDLTPSEKENLQKLENGNFISKFLADYPEYTDRDLSKFSSQLAREGIDLDISLLKKAVVATENRISGKELLCDLEIDAQLKRAVDLLIASRILNRPIIQK